MLWVPVVTPHPSRGCRDDVILLIPKVWQERLKWDTQRRLGRLSPKCLSGTLPQRREVMS